MSRFYKASSSESDSDSDSSSDSGFIQAPQKKVNRIVSSSEDEADEVKRVVKSAKDKMSEQLEKNLNDVKNHLNVNDWTATLNDFESMVKFVEKSSNVIKKEGVPPAYIKALYLIEKALVLDEASKKKMNAKNVKAHQTLKQKMKKTTGAYEAQIKVYRDNPDLIKAGGNDESESEEEEDEDESESESEESESDSDDDGKKKKPAPKKPVAKAAANKPAANSWFKKAGDDDSESDSDYSDSEESDDSTSDSSYSSEEEDTAANWFKKDNKKDTKSSVIVDRKTDEVKRTSKEAKAAVSSPVQQTTTTGDDQDKKLTRTEVLKKLKDTLHQRGKKGTNPTIQIESLESLLGHVTAAEDIFSILFNVINAIFDLAPTIQVSLPVVQWNKAAANILRLIKILEENKSFILIDANDEPDVPVAGKTYVHGSLLPLFERLDDEFTKSLQHLTFPSTDYTERLKDETVLLEIGARTQTYLEGLKQNEKAARAAIRRLEHIYYLGKDNESLVKSLSAFVFQYGEIRLNARTILLNIYFNAIHNRFHEARDLMLMSHMQDNPTMMDVQAQILFNRAMVQLGLCAFRNGYITEAQNCLAEFSGLRKELLAQGLSSHTKFHERDPLREIEEKQRILPGHLHIPLDVIETVNLISGMLIAVPQSAARPFDSKLKICKFYQRHMDHLDKQVFIPPPESFKDIVYAASKSLAAGHYQTTTDLLSTLKLWTMIENSDAVRERLNHIIQEVSLKTFLFTYSVYYDTMRLEELALRFKLPKNHVHSIVSKMMANHEISASWEHSTETIAFHRSEQTKLQHLALNYSESLINFVEQNERIYDSKFGSFRNNKKFDDNINQNSTQIPPITPQQPNQHHRKHHNNNKNRTK